MRNLQLKFRNKQSGLSLFLVLTLLVITISASLFFHNQMVTSTRVSGATRDNSGSMLLTESALENLRGSFINSLDSLCYGNVQAGSTNCGQLAYDKDRAAALREYMDDPDQLGTILQNANLDYIFYVGANGISQTSPSILQSVANGDATASNGGGTFCTIDTDSYAVSGNDCKLRINNLFSNGNAYHPILYTTNDNGRLINSGEANWNTAFANKDTVAAAWMELTVNPDDSSAVDIWVEAAGRVGMASTYVQRYVGTFYASNQLGSLSALIEASNIDRRVSP